MKLSDLYAVFSPFLDENQPGYVLREDAPEDARKAIDEYFSARNKAKGKGLLID